MKKIDFKTVARGTGQSGWVTVNASQIFDFDGFDCKLTEEQAEFLASLTFQWQPVPYRLLDPTTAANFKCYVRAN